MRQSPLGRSGLAQSPQRHERPPVETALLRSAMAMCKDPDEARELVEKTLAAAAEMRLSDVQLFGLLRRTYHSIVRTRRRRPIHDAMVSALARASGTVASVPDTTHPDTPFQDS